MLRYGTVCSGVEAFGPAWEAMGYECVFHAEIAPHPSAVLRYHYPLVPNYGDFSQIQSSPATGIDVLCGGTPCQDFSVAGLRKGLAGKRGNLTLEFAGLAERLRPRWLVWENVPGVLSADGGRAFGQFLTLLAECGYYAAYRVLDAQHFGVPQRRRCVFLVAYLGDWRPAAAVLFESQSLRRNPAPGREAGQDITQALTRSFGAGGIDDNRAQVGFAVVAPLTTKPYADNEAQESRLIVTAECQVGLPSLTVSNTSKHANNQQPLVIADTYAVKTNQTGANGSNVSHEKSFSLNATDKQALVTCVTGQRTHALTAEGFDASEDGTGRGTPIVCHPPLFLHCNKGRPDGRQSAHEAMVTPKELVETLTTNGHQQSAVFAKSAVRRLTPIECERLMGYPDNWTEYGTYANNQVKKIADGPRYQMCGNGWATPVANWVAQRLMMVEELISPTR